MAEALRVRCGDEPVIVEDWVASVHPIAAPLAMAGYRQLIVHCPKVWQWAYRWIETRPETAVGGPGMRFMMEKLADALLKHRPRAIVSTYPLYASLLEMLRTEGMRVPPLLTIITDAVSIHPTWVVSRSNWYAVADEASRSVMKGFGIDETIVEATGFPVSLRFCNAKVRSSDGKRLLYLPSTPGSHVERTLMGLLPLVDLGVELTVVLGRHASRLYQRMRRLQDSFDSPKLNVLGWTEQIPELLLASDLVITKAGGAITHELMAAATPGILDYVVPGQEEGNAEELVRHKGGIVTTTADHTVAAAKRLLIEAPGELREMKAALESIAAPDASMKVADMLLKRLKSVE